MAGAKTLTVPQTRHVIVHYHILKNGGSTIESILEREFGEQFATLHGAADDSILDGEDLAKFLRLHDGLAAVSSHHLRYPRPAPRRIVVFDCCFLRHPLDRLVSLYTWFRNTESSDPIGERARRKTQKEFLTEIVREFPNLVSEVQVTQLANAGAFVRPANERDLDRAMEIVGDAAVLGLVEMFPESLTVAEYFLKPAFPELRLDHAPRNVTRPPSAVSNIERTLIDLWGADLYGDLVKLNRLDLELFRGVQTEIRRRLLVVPGFAGKLADFSSRCAQRAQMEKTATAAG